MLVVQRSLGAPIHFEAPDGSRLTLQLERRAKEPGKLVVRLNKHQVLRRLNEHWQFRLTGETVVLQVRSTADDDRFRIWINAPSTIEVSYPRAG